jgi:riboflavin biosynthesis pyrimidine reductase
LVTLVDEYRLFVYPMFIGAGAGVLAGARHLDLIEATPFPSGITLLRYECRR